MAIAIGDFLQFKVTSLFLGQECLNVFHYRAISNMANWAVEAPNLIEELHQKVIDPVRATQSGKLGYVSVELRNLTNNIDFYEQTVNWIGLINSTEQVAPSSLCYTYRLIRSNLVTRNGYKRFAGIPESRMSGNTSSFGTGELEAVEAGLAMTLEGTDSAGCEPVIIKRPFLPPVLSTHQYSKISGADYRGVGTQNTRKVLFGSAT